MILEQIQLHRSQITIGHRCFREALAPLALKDYSSCFVISQDVVWKYHGTTLTDALEDLGAVYRLRLLPDGEAVKNLTMFGELLHWLAESKADRRSVLIVLGGGVVGDLSGFVAAAYMRGVDWIYLPTTLLAQQDASVGGKVAVNLPQGKNLVGHFWDPRAVIIDGAVLKTLPQRQVNAGFMEFVKHGMLKGGSLFEAMIALPDGIPDWADHLSLLAEGLKVKVDVVRRDPFEKNERRLLNLGHTFGHAVERYRGYGAFLHGEAVGLGLIFACLLARALGGSYDWRPLWQIVLHRLPAVPLDRWDGPELLALTRRDKKGVAGVVAWIVPHEPGKVEIVEGIEDELLLDVFESFKSVLRGP